MSRKFTKNALGNFKKTGTLFPSSRFLAKKIARLIPPRTKNLVELGAGNGAITKSLLDHLPQSAELSCYEINPTFIKLLEKKVSDPRLKILHRSALEINQDFADNSIDAIVSCLPLALFDLEFKQQLLANIQRALKPGGLFIQYQYSLKDKALVTSHFKQSKLSYVVRNIPPAFVYICYK